MVKMARGSEADKNVIIENQLVVEKNVGLGSSSYFVLFGFIPLTPAGVGSSLVQREESPWERGYNDGYFVVVQFWGDEGVGAKKDDSKKVWLVVRVYLQNSHTS